MTHKAHKAVLHCEHGERVRAGRRERGSSCIMAIVHVLTHTHTHTTLELYLGRAFATRHTEPPRLFNSRTFPAFLSSVLLPATVRWLGLSWLRRPLLLSRLPQQPTPSGCSLSDRVSHWFRRHNDQDTIALVVKLLLAWFVIKSERQTANRLRPRKQPAMINCGVIH